MELVECIFCDPGTRNFGVVLLKFVNDKIQVFNCTIDCHDNIFTEIYALEKYILSVKKPVRVFMETNLFRNNYSLTAKLANVTASLQAFLLVKFGLKPGELEIYDRPSMTIAKDLGFPSGFNREAKKNVVTEAFKKIFNTKKPPTNHEADAFAAGASIIVENSQIKVEENLRKLCRTFLDHVSEIFKLHHPELESTRTVRHTRVRSRRPKRNKSKVLANKRQLPVGDIPGLPGHADDNQSVRICLTGDSDSEHDGDGAL